MNENERQFEHSTRAIFGLSDAWVEDHRIRPRMVGDDRIEMSVLMRISGDFGTYYLRSEVVFTAGEDAGHHVQITRRGGMVVETMEMELAGDRPDGCFEATQRLCEAYISRVEDWYSKAVAADEQAGDDDV